MANKGSGIIARWRGRAPGSVRAVDNGTGEMDKSGLLNCLIVISQRAGGLVFCLRVSRWNLVKIGKKAWRKRRIGFNSI